MPRNMADNINNRLVIRELLIGLFNDSSSSDSEDDEIDHFPLLALHYRRKIPKIQNYVENVVSIMDYDLFRSNFRISKHTVLEIEQMIIEDNLLPPATPRLVTVHKQILMTLWILGSQESFRSVAERFDVSKSTLWTCCAAMWKAIAKLSTKVIKWPSITEMVKLSEDFESIASFPGVIGCVDGTHIPIKAPVVHHECYVDRNNVISIVLQGVANDRLEFLDCYAGEVGSVHDAKVFRKSSLGQNLPNMVPECYHLLGDAAYPLMVNLITPFKDNGHLTIQQTNYNKKLSQTRSTVERAFGLLKGKWRRLKYLDMNRTELIPTVIIACCVLHNLARFEHNDEDLNEIEDIDEYENDNSESNRRIPLSATHKRHTILQSIG